MARLTMEFAVDIEDGNAQTWKRRLIEDAKYALLVVDDDVFSTTLMMEPVEGEWNLVEADAPAETPPWHASCGLHNNHHDASSAATCRRLRAAAEGEKCPTTPISK